MTMLILKIISLVLASLALGIFGVSVFIAACQYCEATGANMNPQAPFGLAIPIAFGFIAPEKVDEWLHQASYNTPDVRTYIGIVMLYWAICFIMGVWLGLRAGDRYVAEDEAEACNANTSITTSGLDGKLEKK